VAAAGELWLDREAAGAREREKERGSSGGGGAAYDGVWLGPALGGVVLGAAATTPWTKRRQRSASGGG